MRRLISLLTTRASLQTPRLAPCRARAVLNRQASSPSLSAAALRERVSLALGAPACALYARSLGLDALLLRDGPTRARPHQRASPLKEEDEVLALAVDGLAGGLYACLPSRQLRAFLLERLLPAAGAHPSRPADGAAGDLAAAAGAHAGAAPRLRAHRLEGSRCVRLFGEQGDACDSDEDTSAEVAEPLRCGALGGGAAAGRGDDASATAGVPEAKSAASIADAAPPCGCAIAAADCGCGASGAAEARGLRADVCAIRREVSQTGQTVGAVLGEMRFLAQSLAALDPKRRGTSI